jgi:hypothetical protein
MQPSICENQIRPKYNSCSTSLLYCTLIRSTSPHRSFFASLRTIFCKKDKWAPPKNHQSRKKVICSPVTNAVCLFTTIFFLLLIHSFLLSSSCFTRLHSIRRLPTTTGESTNKTVSEECIQLFKNIPPLQ